MADNFAIRGTMSKVNTILGLIFLGEDLFAHKHDDFLLTFYIYILNNDGFVLK